MSWFFCVVQVLLDFGSTGSVASFHGLTRQVVAAAFMEAALAEQAYGYAQASIPLLEQAAEALGIQIQLSGKTMSHARQ